MTEVIPIIEPIYKNNSIAIGMACSNEYVPYLSICLLSLIENTNINNKYDIIIFENNITEYNKNILINSFIKDNISLRFYNINSLPLDGNFSSIASRYSSISYVILFIPELFKNYSRVLFTDCDLIFKGDVDQLLNIDLEGKQACAVSDLVMDILVNTTDSDWKDYCKKELKLQNTNEYFNSGVMVYDIQECKKNKFTEKTIKIAKNKNRIFIQGILNKYFCGNIKYMNNEWNVDIIDIYNNKNFQFMSEKCKAMYFKSLANPKVLHWAGIAKPWENPQEIFAHYWWELARKSPYYEIILEQIIYREMQKKFDKLEDKYNNLYQENLSLQNQRNNELLQLYNKLNHNFLEKIFYLANYRKNLASYWRYTILSKILIGKKRTHYSMKRQL